MPVSSAELIRLGFRDPEMAAQEIAEAYFDMIFNGLKR